VNMGVYMGPIMSRRIVVTLETFSEVPEIFLLIKEERVNMCLSKLRKSGALPLRPTDILSWRCACV
jgi:hypothetical protein